jgi:hypothetical protein
LFLSGRASLEALNSTLSIDDVADALDALDAQEEAEDELRAITQRSGIP